ncbi:MAG: thioredoxin family protein [Bacteroidetes bacterium]|nr:thioredoxin family protein [Bacteroidota bacterium]
MKRRIFIIVLCLLAATAFSQEENQVYNPNADAKKDVYEAIAKARQEKKHVLIQIGGNWCEWCLAFHNFIESNTVLKSYIHKSYEVVYVNYSKENKNSELMKTLEYPDRFGFPVFVILDDSGRRIHTQDNSFLIDNREYDLAKVMLFVSAWTYEAVHPSNNK